MSGGEVAAPTVVREPWRSGALSRLRELVAYRHLYLYFGRRFVEKRYARTWLGWLWIPMRPALDVGARAFLFGSLLGVQSGDRPYLIFFIVGMAAWHLFERAAYWGTRSQEVNRGLMRRIHVPRIVMVAAAAVPALVDYALYGLITVLALTYFKLSHGVWYVDLGPSTLWLLPGLAAMVMLGLAIALWTSHYAAQARDIRFAQGYAIGFLFFITPVIYPLSSVPEQYRILAELNPVTAPIETVKLALLGTAAPTSLAVTSCLAFLAFALVGGIVHFNRSEAAAVARL